MRIKRDEVVGVVVDVQERLFPFIAENEKLSDKIVRMIKGMQVLGIPIIVTEQYRKGLGETLNPIQNIFGKFEFLEKDTFSCCGDQHFMESLNRIGKKYVIVCGIESHVCVLQTVIDLIENEYIPILVEDCVSSRSLNDKNFAVKRMRSEGAIITTYESLLFELLEVSGTEEFKKISKIVK